MTNEQFTVSSCAVNQAPKNPDTRTSRGQLGAGPPPARLHYRGSVTDTAASPLPPQAGRKPAPRTHHGAPFEDPYECLRAKDDAEDRQSVVWGKRVYVRVEHGDRALIKKKKK